MRDAEVGGLEQDTAQGGGVVAILLQGPYLRGLDVVQDVLEGRDFIDVPADVDLVGLEAEVRDMVRLQESEGSHQVVCDGPELVLAEALVCFRHHLNFSLEVLVECFEDQEALSAKTVLNLVHAVGLGFGGVGEFQKVEGVEKVGVMVVVVALELGDRLGMYINYIVNLLEIDTVCTIIRDKDEQNPEDRVLNSPLVGVVLEEGFLVESRM